MSKERLVLCGIAGRVSLNTDQSVTDSVRRMLDTIVHRGPDGWGVETLDGHVGLGHRRLAILDLTEKGKQPMCRANRYWITFNGEIYNYLELRQELQAMGEAFRTDTDTEVLLAAYARWGTECVSHFNGMWAFAIYDAIAQTLFCSRDRFGVKPFYYTVVNDQFFFASEIKALLAVLPQRPKADMTHLAAYLADGILDADEGTMFDGVSQLLGGYNLLLDCRDLSFRISRWYDLRTVKANNNTKEQNYALFREKFLHSVGLRLRSDVPVGSCLSGGLDSSSIVCAVHELLEEKRKRNDSVPSQYTISSCFEDLRYDEREYSDAVVKHTGATHYQVFPDMGKVFTELDKIIWHMDEPFGGTSIYAQWCVFREAKKNGLIVMLDGQGADEQLAGYTPFYRVLFLQLLKTGQWGRLFHEMKCYQSLRAGSEPIPTRELLLSVLGTWLLPDSVRFWLNKLWRRKSEGRPLPAYMYDNPLSVGAYLDYDKRDVQKFIYTSLQHGMRALLHYEDRDSMAYSIEARVPFLDYELAEFIYSVPFDQKIENGRTKNLLREGLKDILPEKIYNRISKLGFVTPEDVWLKENEEFFYKELNKACDRLSRVLDKEKVLQWYKGHVKATRCGDTTCFRIICAAHWADVFDVMVG